MITVIMPQVGQDIPTATIVEWKKKANDPIEKGEVIAVVESDKAAFEIEAEQAGVLIETLYAEGDEVAVFEPIAYIGKPGESADPVVAPAEVAAQQPGQASSRGSVITDNESVSSPSDRIFVSPAARRLAREHEIDVEQLQGSGPNDRVVLRDVRAALDGCQLKTSSDSPGTSTTPSEDTVIRFSRTRRRIAERVTQSAQTIPHFYLNVDVDMTAAQRWRKSFNCEHPEKVTVTDLTIKACARALHQFPRVNAHVEPDRMILKASVNIGVATTVEDGLLVPVIAGAANKPLTEISAELKQNTAAAQRGSVKMKHKSTFTITSLGMYGVRSFVPIINPPECAILGVGAIQKRAVPIADSVAVREMMTLTLGADHRALDGVEAAQFLGNIKRRLEDVKSL